MPTFVFSTSVGAVHIQSEVPRPRVLLVHGFARRPLDMAPWSRAVGDIGYLKLPGHWGAPDLSEVSIETWVGGFREALATFDTPPLIIAESLGAVLSLTLPSRALVAIEPLLSTHQLWPLHQSVAAARARGVEIDPALMGLFDRPFHTLLPKIAAPTLVIAGSEPLMPPRRLSAEPSLLSDLDFTIYAGLPGVEAMRIAGGHALMQHNAAGVIAASAAFRARHGYPPPADDPQV